MNEIMQSISEAEQKAALIREQALSRAAEIAAQAEADAAALKKAAEEKAKNARERGIRVAQEQAQADYEREIASKTQSARSYAQEQLPKTEQIEKDIVRRICSGC